MPVSLQIPQLDRTTLMIVGGLLAGVPPVVAAAVVIAREAFTVVAMLIALRNCTHSEFHDLLLTYMRPVSSCNGSRDRKSRSTRRIGTGG